MQKPQTAKHHVEAKFNSYADGHKISLHAHDRDQLLYATKGVIRLITEHAAWIVPPKNAAFIPAGTLHAVDMHGEVYMNWLFVGKEAAENRLRQMKVIAISGLMHELILDMMGQQGETEADVRRDLIARLLRLELKQLSDLSLNIPLPTDPRLQRLCAHLISDPSDRRTLDAWSEVAGASTRTLARLFERELGMSFNQWRQRIRFHNALENLSQGQSVAQAAHNNGYKSASAFSMAFTKIIGVPPSKIAK